MPQDPIAPVGSAAASPAGAGAGGVPLTPPAAGAPQSGAPMGGPMATPQQKLGEQQNAKASVQVAMMVLARTQSAFDPMSEEAKAVRKALDIIAKAFGESAHEGRELVPTEIAQLMQGLKQPGMGPGAGAKPPGAPAAPMGAM